MIEGSLTTMLTCAKLKRICLWIRKLLKTQHLSLDSKYSVLRQVEYFVSFHISNFYNIRTFHLSDKTIDITKDIFVDIDDSGRLAGIEVLHASEKTNLPDLLNLTLKLFPQNKEFRIQVPDMINI